MPSLSVLTFLQFPVLRHGSEVAITTLARPWIPEVSPPVTLHAVNPLVAQSCANFFDAVKTPAALIAGSSLISLFSFTRDVQETYRISKVKIMFLRLYHVACLLCFCFSLMTLISAHTASVALLLGETQRLVAKSPNAYTFLTSHMNLEFISTWLSFGLSMLLLIISTTLRMVIDFGLFAPTRRWAGTMVVSMMSGITCALLSFVNASSMGWPQLPPIGPVTQELALRFSNRAYILSHPLQMASLVLLGIAALSSLRFLLPRSIEYDQMMDTKRYT